MNMTGKTWKPIALALALALVLAVALGIGGWVVTRAYAQRPWGSYGGGYGMGMMGGGWGYGRAGGTSSSTPSPDMPLDKAKAIELAQKYLDTARPGITADEEEVYPFYGYYTLHVLQDGEVTGMLSVNGYTGQVWYHTWHGAFVDMTGH